MLKRAGKFYLFSGSFDPLYVCESTNDIYLFFKFNLMVFVKVRCYKKQGFGQNDDDF